MLVDLPTPLLARKAVAQRHLLHCFICRTLERGAFIDHAYPGLLRTLAGQMDVNRGHHRVLQHIGILNVSASQIKCGIHPGADVLTVRHLEDHPLLIMRWTRIDELRIPVGRPLAFLVGSEERRRLLKASVRGEVELGARVRQFLLR